MNGRNKHNHGMTMSQAVIQIIFWTQRVKVNVKGSGGVIFHENKIVTYIIFSKPII